MERLRRLPVLIPAVLLLAVLAAAPVRAAPKALGSFGAWAAYSFAENKARVCYVYATPKASHGKYKKRGPTYVQVTRRPAKRVRNEVSVTAGYTYRKGSDVEIEIGGRKFTLFTSADTAWARDARGDAALVAAMKAGQKMTVRGVSARGTRTVDTYSLTGFTAAHAAIGKACPIK